MSDYLRLDALFLGERLFNVLSIGNFFSMGGTTY